MTVRVARPLVAVSGGVARWRAATALPIVLVGIGYYAGSLAGFALRLPDSGISFLWPPTAILTAALMLAHPREWVRYMVAALVAHGVAHALDGLPLATSLGLFAANGAQALLAAFLVRRFSRDSPLFSDLHTVTVFIVGGSIVAPAAAALAASIGYVQLGWATDFLHAWSARLLSNFIASVTIVPPIVLTVEQFRSRRPIPLTRILQLVGSAGRADRGLPHRDRVLAGRRTGSTVDAVPADPLLVMGRRPPGASRIIRCAPLHDTVDDLERAAGQRLLL